MSRYCLEASFFCGSSKQEFWERSNCSFTKSFMDTQEIIERLKNIEQTQKYLLGNQLQIMQWQEKQDLLALKRANPFKKDLKHVAIGIAILGITLLFIQLV